jgi:hypothetical protein
MSAVVRECASLFRPSKARSATALRVYQQISFRVVYHLRFDYNLEYVLQTIAEDAIAFDNVVQ